MEASNAHKLDIQLEKLIISCQSGAELPELRDTLSLLRTAIPTTEEDKAIAEANISYAQAEGVLIDQEITRVEQSLEKFKRETDILDTTSQIVVVDPEYLRMNRSLEKLHSQRRTLRRFEELERGLLAPIRRLPVEVLQDIFQLAHSIKTVHVHDFKVFPRAAAQVSSYWRYASLSCASLWTEIVCGAGKLPKNLSKYGELLEDCLELSNGMPLKIVLSYQTKAEVLGEGGIQALVRSAQRWKESRIVGADLTKAIFSSIPNGFTFTLLEMLDLIDITNTIYIAAAPKLRYLKIAGNNYYHTSIFRIEIDCAPSLEQLTIHCISHPSTALTGIQWSLITCFESYYIHYKLDEFASVLESMPYLTSLSCDGHIGTTRSVTLPCLEALKLIGAGGERAKKLLDTVKMPRLVKLDAQCGIDLSTLAQRLRQFRCILKELHLHREGTSHDGFLREPEFASITTLYWSSPYFFGTILQWLTLDNNPSPQDIFPKLENIHILYVDQHAEDVEHEWEFPRLIDMLKSRLQPQSTDTTRKKLKYIEIKFSGHSDVNNIALFREFMQSELVNSPRVQMDIYVWNGLEYSLLTA